MAEVDTDAESSSPPSAAQQLSPSAAQPSTPMKVDVRWVCNVQKAGVDEAPSGPLPGPMTVGEKFVVTCEGDTASLQKEKLILQLPKNEMFTLRLLRVQELTDNRCVLTVTSYKVGASTLKEVALSDGTRAIGLDGIRFELSSVVNPQENPEGKMFAPASPVALAWPMWIWLVCGAVLALLALWGLAAFRIRSQRRELLDELARHGTALTPYNQFNKDVRALGRQFPLAQTKAWTPEMATQFIEEVNRCFRWYLAREFIVPAFRWSPDAIIRELRRKHERLYQRIEAELRLALSELSKGLAAREKISALDGQQILDLCRKVADDVQRERREVRS